ncbi:craniofacial development protein 2-like [Moschus berezovskii]|uniref:craniofacial development protein 2-like n=1 Tax=Moschus berezovskii TaxID=68408 RepID=UPI0024452CBC|nr:craniofacial development protein 2-like [Moschus berezovskii]
MAARVPFRGASRPRSSLYSVSQLPAPPLFPVRPAPSPPLSPPAPPSCPAPPSLSFCNSAPPRSPSAPLGCGRASSARRSRLFLRPRLCLPLNSPHRCPYSPCVYLALLPPTSPHWNVRCCKEQYCIGTWNVRSMNQGKLEVVKQEMARVNVDILGISELKWTGMGEFNSDDHYIYYCGQESLRRNGVAIMVNKRVRNAVLGCNLKNDRMISVRFQGKPFNITVIQVYAPTSNAEEAEVEQFYEDLQDLLELTPKKDVLFIIGDWNAKVGSQETPGVTGKFGLGARNEAGQRLIEFCQRNTLVIANTLFQQHKRRLYTWTSPDGQYQNQIDYILCSQRWRSSIQSAKTRPGADCGSDHELLIAKFRLKLKKVGKTTRPFRYDLNQIPYDYTVEVRNRFKGLDLIDRVPDELWMEVRDIVQETFQDVCSVEKLNQKASKLDNIRY